MPSQSERGLEISPHMVLVSVPAESPQLNPVENMWQEIGEKSGLNLSFESMEQLEMDLAPVRMKLENEP